MKEVLKLVHICQSYCKNKWHRSVWDMVYTVAVDWWVSVVCCRRPKWWILCRLIADASSICPRQALESVPSKVFWLAKWLPQTARSVDDVVNTSTTQNSLHSVVQFVRFYCCWNVCVCKCDISKWWWQIDHLSMLLDRGGFMHVQRVWPNTGPHEKGATQATECRTTAQHFLPCGGLFTACCDIRKSTSCSTTFSSLYKASEFRKLYLKSGNSSNKTKYCR